MVIQPLSTRLIKPNFCFDLPHRRSTTVSLETRNPFTTQQLRPRSSLAIKKTKKTFTVVIQPLSTRLIKPNDKTKFLF